MPISALPTPPSRSDSPQDFSDRADALLGALPGFVTEANALQSDVNAKEASVSSYATIATNKAAEAQASANTAGMKASEAAASAIAAAAAANNAEIAFDSFDDKYLGSKASDPTTDNDGNALLVGALYWNTTVGAVRVWNGSAWLSMAADASIVDFQQAGAGAVVRTAQDKLCEWVSVKDFGAVGDGVTDDTAAIQAALAAHGAVLIPSGATCITSGNTLASYKTLIVDGVLRLKANSPAGTKMLVNSDQVGGNTNIRIIGIGTLDGNKANQTGATDAIWHTLVDIENCDYFEFSVAKITGNYFPVATPSDKTTGAVYVRNSSYVKIHDSIGTDYGRECFWCQSCDDSEMYNLRGIGGTDSWSVVQFSGDRCRAQNICANNAGASGASFDVRYSTVSDVVNYANRFQNGINFGHDGVPSDGTVAKNIVSINAAIGSSNSGIQVAANTSQFILDGFRVAGSAGDGVKVSDGADNIRVCNGVSTGNAGFGLTLFTADATSPPRFVVTNVDLRGNTAGPYSRGGGQVSEQFEKVRLSDDALFAFQSVAALGAGGTVTVTNGNVRSTSRVILTPSNLAGINALPFVQTINDGSFVIQTVNSGAGGAGTRYYIL